VVFGGNFSPRVELARRVVCVGSKFFITLISTQTLRGQMKAIAPQKAGSDALVKGLRALGDPTRLRLIQILAKQDATGHDLAQALQLSPSTVSQHLHILMDEHLLNWRQRGRHRDYFLLPGAILELARNLQALVHKREEAQQVTRAFREEVLGQFIESPTHALPKHPRRLEIILEWLVSKLHSGEFYGREQLEELWKDLIEDWDELLVKLEDSNLLIGNGSLWLRNEGQSVQNFGTTNTEN
jgi:DNA-binding transcriptional ArsR family regulator